MISPLDLGLGLESASIGPLEFDYWLLNIDYIIKGL